MEFNTRNKAPPPPKPTAFQPCSPHVPPLSHSSNKEARFPSTLIVIINYVPPPPRHCVTHNAALPPPLRHALPDPGEGETRGHLWTCSRSVKD
ncbi:hypothetical protein EYF80_005034 [Liparis tanakae]|uniref:Uncharacterized protein n=1 Tax=Liparis tanakae TaxID=230148 RepID=A0A4Z2J328_9TELE|nr:hypothetical protein EYF80_005034 [Liparis tanakae]